MKYGRGDVIAYPGGGLNEKQFEDLDDEKFAPKAEALADDLEKMGPTFVKLGQLLSTRPDILPNPYLKALSRLQDRVEPVPFEEIEQIVVSELGVKISRAFAFFDKTPMASASLGQVHKAQLRDGRLVAVKVQRPHIRDQVAKDIESLMEVAEFLDQHTELGVRYELTKMLEEFRKSFIREFDYRLEARNLKTLHNNLREFDRIVVPLPINDYTTEKVLTMDYVDGRKFTSLSPMAKLEIKGPELADQLFQAYLKQVLVDGFFHADPHPGNLFLTSDGKIALLDLGMTGLIRSGLQDKLLQLLHAVSESRAEDSATIAIKIGEARDDFDESCFRGQIVDLISRNDGLKAGQIEVGTILLEFTKVSGNCGLRLPHELTMLAKTLLNLDQVGTALHPEFDPNAAIRKHAMKLVQQRVWKSFSVGSLLGGVIEIKDIIEQLPSKLAAILDTISKNQLRVKVDALDERLLMAGLQKIANRITLGLILAALIVGASRLMSIPTEFQILGYPGLAIIFFLAAAGGGIALILEILFYDEPSKR
jgi:predicted unusual protein kinase regulating ubiquinone biosynthesis (AarF/ABC1/UbiB family)